MEGEGAAKRAAVHFELNLQLAVVVFAQLRRDSVSKAVGFGTASLEDGWHSASPLAGVFALDPSPGIFTATASFSSITN
jgi:hypothetical protein